MTSPVLPSAADIAGAVRRGETTAVAVIERHLRVIARRNPDLNALTVVFTEQARATAAEVDAAVSGRRDPGPLAGVPFSVKENIDLTWSATTNGWRGHAAAVPPRDAAVVRRLRAAGAVPVGRGNMPDFGMRWDTDNDLFGRTVNPWNPGRSVGGSSGGDAVAVATGMSAIALGNDFGGSLRIPAYATGAVGMRPSRGRVPRAAVQGRPVALTLQEFSVNGPLARRVDDVALALGVMSGWDADDPVSVDAPLVRADAVPRRVGVVRRPGGIPVDPDVAVGIERAAEALAPPGGRRSSSTRPCSRRPPSSGVGCRAPTCSSRSTRPSSASPSDARRHASSATAPRRRCPTRRRGSTPTPGLGAP